MKQFFERSETNGEKAWRQTRHRCCGGANKRTDRRRVRAPCTCGGRVGQIVLVGHRELFELAPAEPQLAAQVRVFQQLLQRPGHQPVVAMRVQRRPAVHGGWATRYDGRTDRRAGQSAATAAFGRRTTATAAAMATATATATATAATDSASSRPASGGCVIVAGKRATIPRRRGGKHKNEGGRGAGTCDRNV